MLQQSAVREVNIMSPPVRALNTAMAPLTQVAEHLEVSLRDFEHTRDSAHYACTPISSPWLETTLAYMALSNAFSRAYGRPFILAY
jgi:hypothetical protein